MERFDFTNWLSGKIGNLWGFKDANLFCFDLYENRFAHQWGSGVFLLQRKTFTYALLVCVARTARKCGKSQRFSGKTHTFFLLQKPKAKGRFLRKIMSKLWVLMIGSGKHSSLSVTRLSEGHQYRDISIYPPYHTSNYRNYITESYFFLVSLSLSLNCVENVCLLWVSHWTGKPLIHASASLLSHHAKQMCNALLNPSFFPASLLQGSSQWHGEYPSLSLPGGRVHCNWTVVGCGPPPLPGFLRGSSGAQHRLPVCPSSSHPLRVLHHGTDTLFLHGRADPASGRCVCLSAKIRGGLFFFRFVCLFW